MVLSIPFFCYWVHRTRHMLVPKSIWQRAKHMLLKLARPNLEHSDFSSQWNRDHCEKWWARWIQTTTFHTTLFCTVYEWHLSQEYGYFNFISTIQVPFDTTKHFLWEILLIHGAKKCRLKGWWFWFNLVLFTHSFFVLHLLFYDTTKRFPSRKNYNMWWLKVVTESQQLINQNMV